MNEDFEAQAKAWRDERITKINDHVTPVPLPNNRYLVLHIMPSENINFDNQAEKLRMYFQVHNGSIVASNNFDGVILNLKKDKPLYTQFFRAGGIECISPLDTYNIVEYEENDDYQDEKVTISTISMDDCIQKLRTNTLNYIRGVYNCTGLEKNSYFVSVSFLNVKGHSATLKKGEGHMGREHTAKIPYLNLQFKEIIIDKMPETLLKAPVQATPTDWYNYTEALLPIIKHMVAVTGSPTNNEDINFLFKD